MKVSLHPEAEQDIEAAAGFDLREGSPRVKGSEIRVLVVKHDRKRPGYGTSRT